MNHFRYDVPAKTYSFGYLNDDQVMDLTKEETLLYKQQLSLWEQGEGESYGLLMLMAKTKAIHEHYLYTCGD